MLPLDIAVYSSEVFRISISSYSSSDFLVLYYPKKLKVATSIVIIIAIT